MSKCFRGKENFMHASFIAALAIALAISACDSTEHWSVEDVTGHLPDLNFSLTSDEGRSVTARTYEGNVLLMYFGFTHCQAECPVSMARLARLMQLLGDDANRARILFVTVDPKRDTPQELRRYLTQFDPEHSTGLTGPPEEIGRLARRYRNAFRPRVPAGGDGNVTHGDAIYIFDARGRARLLATSADLEANLAEDLRRLLEGF